MFGNLSPDILYIVQSYLGKSFEMLFLSKYIYSCAIPWFYDNIVLNLNIYPFNKHCKCIYMKDGKCDVWPVVLKKLYLSNNFYDENKLLLPDKLEILSFGYESNYDLSNVIWPDNLVHLSLGVTFNYPLDNVIFPQSLKVLDFSSRFNHSLDNVIFPKNLKMLILSSDFNHPLENVKFPDSIKLLILGNDFNHPIDNVQWPAKLEELFFSEDFNQRIDRTKWPANLKELDLGFAFNFPVKNIPETVEILKLGFELEEKYYYEFIKKIPQNLKVVVYKGNLNYYLPHLNKNMDELRRQNLFPSVHWEDRNYTD
jgi:hypothetical protein